MPVALRLLAAGLTAAALAACAQQPPVMTSSRPAVQEGARKAVARHRVPSMVARHHAEPASEQRSARTKSGSYGLASFYSYDPHTASGEKFDKNELTAAHRTFPFGTRLRLTHLTTAPSPTLRVHH